MALTNTELESALTALTTRVANIEKAIKNLMTIQQLNAISLLLEKDIKDLKTDVTSLKSRVGTLESNVDGLV